MNRVIHFVLACCFSFGVLAANPSFQSFNTDQFDTAANRVALKNGLQVTNIVLFGSSSNLFEVWNVNDELKFYIDTNGVAFPSLWSDAGSSTTLSSAPNVAIGQLPSLLPANTLTLTLQGTNNNELFQLQQGSHNMNAYGAIQDDSAHSWDGGFYQYWDSGTNASQTFFLRRVSSPSRIFTLLDPNQDLGDIPYIFDTSKTVSSGNLFAIRNNGTNVLVVPFDGIATIPSLIIENNITVKGNAVLNVFTANSGTVSNSLTLLGGLNITTGNLTNGGTYVGTIDGAATGTTLKQIKSLKLQFPRLVDGAGCTYANTNDYTALTFMLPQFSGSAAASANYCDFAFRVPTDLDTSVDLTASLTIRLGAADTSAQAYDVGMVSIANSSPAAGTPANFVTLTVGADASGASGDIEGVSAVTLTSWKSNLTAGQWCLLRLRRDGTDASTQVSNLMELEIFYTSTQ